MAVTNVSNKEIDLNEPLEIAPRTWWVGTYLEDDSFQCHVYLLESGKESVLVDPGSALTFKHALKKVEKILPFSHIKYFLCHHQDPDITGALQIIDQLVSRDDAVVISHWRGIALLRHYDLKLPFICVEKDLNWRLKIGERDLEFVFTPYLHFPGAFTTFERATGVLLSSDIFGGFTEDWTLYAKDQSYFDSIRSFHEHYMPAKEILQRALAKFEALPLKLIAPQHGSLIQGNLIPLMINGLKNLDCGILMLAQTSTQLNRLSELNRMLKTFLNQIVFSRGFDEVAALLRNEITNILPLSRISFYVKRRTGDYLHYRESVLFSGIPTQPPEWLANLFDLDKKQWDQTPYAECALVDAHDQQDSGSTELLLPILSTETKKVFAITRVELKEKIEIDDETREILKQIRLPLGIALERELIQQVLELERQAYYEQAVRDQLTGLYSRTYMTEAVQRLIELHNRDQEKVFSCLILDIDNFKQVNDTFGHLLGDKVLAAVGDVLSQETRGGDIAVRFGGEEMILFLNTSDPDAVDETADRVRRSIKALHFSAPLNERTITVSGGLAAHRQEESLNGLISRADAALYESKGSGKNRITRAD